MNSTQGADQCNASLVFFPPNVPTDADKQMRAVREVAQGAYRLLQAAVGTEIWRSTPYHRFQQRLDPDLLAPVFSVDSQEC